MVVIQLIMVAVIFLTSLILAALNGSYMLRILGLGRQPVLATRTGVRLLRQLAVLTAHARHQRKQF